MERKKRRGDALTHMATETNRGVKQSRSADSFNVPDMRAESDMPLEVSVSRFAESRALELEALSHTVEKIGGTKLAFQRLPRHMRRRAMSHNIQRIPRRLRLKMQAELEKRDKKGKIKCPSRRHRRRPSNLLSEYYRRQRKHAWLETHIWHAKRFKMTSLWGYRLPLHPSDKSLRACYRASTQHCLLQDISFEICIELIGERKTILEALSHVTNSEAGLTFGAKATSTGQRWGEVTLFTCDSYPFGAVGPVSYLWQASVADSLGIHDIRSGVEKMHTGLEEFVAVKDRLWIWCHPACYQIVWNQLVKACTIVTGSNDSVLSSVYKSEEIACPLDCSNNKIQTCEEETKNLSAKTDVIVDQNLANKTSSECTKLQVGRVEISSLKDQLVRFRLTGPDVHLILYDVLSLACVDSQECRVGDFVTDLKSEHEKLNNDREITPKTGNQANFQISTLDINGTTSEAQESEKITLQSMDSSFSSTRWWQDYYSTQSATVAFHTQNTTWQHVTKCQSPGEIPPRAVLALTIRDPRILLPSSRVKVAHLESAWMGNSRLTWEHIPVAAALSPLWDAAVRHEVTATKVSEHKLNLLRSELLVPGSTLELGDKESRIPVILLHHPGVQVSRDNSNQNHFKQASMSRNGLGGGWDILAPRGWGMALWIALVYRGARVGGLREARSVDACSGSLHFPDDFPDTLSGQQHQTETRQQLFAKYVRRPPAKRCNFARLGVSTPFDSPFGQLVKEWKESQAEVLNALKDDLTSTEPVTISDSKNNGDSAAQGSSRIGNKVPIICSLAPEKSLEFYVLRCRRLLRILASAVCQSRLGHSGDKINITDCTLLSFLLRQSHCSDLILKHASSLVPVSVSCLHRGVPSDRAMICLPSASDLQMLTQDPHFSGPVEQLHPCFTYSKAEVPKKKKCNLSSDKCNVPDILSCNLSRKKQKNRQNSSKLPVKFEQPTSLIDSSNRPIIGFLTIGGFELSVGTGSGTGFCALVGMLSLLQNTTFGKPCLVLIRNTTSRQYRFARLSVLT